MSKLSNRDEGKKRWNKYDYWIREIFILDLKDEGRISQKVIFENGGVSSLTQREFDYLPVEVIDGIASFYFILDDYNNYL